MLFQWCFFSGVFSVVAFNNLNRFYGRPFLPKAEKGKKPKRVSKVKRGSAKSKAKAKAKTEPAPKRAKN